MRRRGGDGRKLLRELPFLFLFLTTDLTVIPLDILLIGDVYLFPLKRALYSYICIMYGVWAILCVDGIYFYYHTHSISFPSAYY